MSDFVTYVEADVTPAEVVTLVVRTKARVAAQSSAFCGDLSSNTWFPVAPGTTLPSPPAATTNASPAPANSVPLPSGLDPNDTCYIFQDLLPVTSAPVYAEELEPVAVLPPYIEELPLLGITVAGMSIVEWPYALTLPASSIEAVTRSVINIPTYNVTLEAGAYALNGQDAAVVRRYTLVGAAGSYALAGQAAAVLYSRVLVGAAGSFTQTGQDAGLVYQRLPMALDAGSYALTGQDASLFKGITMVADAGSYTLSGQDAEKIRGYMVTGDAGTYTLTGQGNLFAIKDAFYANTSLLLHFNGSNNSTTFTDNSPNALTINARAQAVISTAQSVFGGSSGYFNGSNAYIRYASNSVFDFPGDFTIEFRIYQAATGNTTFPIPLERKSSAASSYGFILDNSGANTSVSFTYGSPTNYIPVTSNMSKAAWHALAVTRSGSTLRTFFNGTLATTTTVSNDFTSTVPLVIGMEGGLSFNPFNGYIEELRITKGVARYIDTYSVQSAQFQDS